MTKTLISDSTILGIKNSLQNLLDNEDMSFFARATLEACLDWLKNEEAGVQQKEESI